MFTKSVYDAGELDENSVGDTVVAIVSASDADAGAAGNIQYVIDDEPAKTFFKVNARVLSWELNIWSIAMSDREHTRWQHNRIYPHPISPCVYTYD